MVKEQVKNGNTKKPCYQGVSSFEIVRWIDCYSKADYPIADIVDYERNFIGEQSAEVVMNRISRVGKGKVGLLLSLSAFVRGYTEDMFTYPASEDSKDFAMRQFKAFLKDLNPENPDYDYYSRMIACLAIPDYCFLETCEAGDPSHKSIVDLADAMMLHSELLQGIDVPEYYSEAIVDKEDAVIAVIVKDTAGTHHKNLAIALSKGFNVPVIRNYIWDDNNFMFNTKQYSKSLGYLSSILADRGINQESVILETD